MTGLEDFDRLEILNRFYNPASLELCYKAGIASHSKIAEIGCGHGTMSFLLANQIVPTGEVWAVDNNAEQIRVARERYSDCSNLHFFESNLLHDTEFLKAEAGKFDAVYCRFLLQHLDNPIQMLRCMAELLKPGGLLICEDADVTKLRYSPADEDINEWQRYWFALGRALGASYEIAPCLAETLQSAGLTVEHHATHQPHSHDPAAKAMHVLGFRDLMPLYVEKGGATLERLQFLLHKFELLIADSDVEVELYEVHQCVARKGSFSNEAGVEIC
jgi:ubiquinone/menaquinone biosynthesis C-methylase UbiE